MTEQSAGIDRITEPRGARDPFGSGQAWPTRVDSDVTDGIDPDEVEWVRSASVGCSNGDAIDRAVQGGRIVGVRGRARDRVNRGRLRPRDLFGWQGLASTVRSR